MNLDDRITLVSFPAATADFVPVNGHAQKWENGQTPNKYDLKQKEFAENIAIFSFKTVPLEEVRVRWGFIKPEEPCSIDRLVNHAEDQHDYPVAIT